MILKDGIFTSTLFEDFPVVHGFTTRTWGNLGFGKNANDPDVVASRRKLFEALNLTGRIHVQPRQAHSDRCIAAVDFFSGQEADASFSSSPQHLLSALTADCVPILLYHPDGVVAVIHAGWRGLYSEILPKTLAKLPPKPFAAVGPAIGPCCYEVSEEMASDFESKFGKEIVMRGESKPHLDLIGVATLQLQQADAEIDGCHLCTFCHPDLFFSYRREGSSGRMMSFIGLK